MWEMFAILIGTVVFLYYLISFYLKGNNDFWPKRSVPLVLSSEVGTLFELLTKKKTILQMDQGYYEKFRAGNHRFGGTMEFRKPILLITDLDLVKQVLVKDFDHFVDRRQVEFKHEPLFSEMVVMLEGQKWKDVRSVLSPTFTTGKMRRMFEQFNDCGKGFVKCIKSQEPNDGGYNIIIQDMVNRFTVDVIGATAFGINTNALNDPNSIFYLMAKRISEISVFRIIKNIIFVVSPKVASTFGLRLFDKDIMDFFTDILYRTLKNREEGGEKRNDFLQLLVEARRGELSLDEGELDAFEKDAHLQGGTEGHKHGKALFTDTLTSAQSFIFFIAGFDTVGSLVSFAAYLMAANPEMQERIYEEVKTSMRSGEIDYDTVNRLEYMDKFISEILRRYPPANRLERRCVKEYKIPDSELVLEKNQVIAVSIQGTHMDPEYYPEPEKFDPERFSAENKAARHPYAYMPFGHGPRNCIGMRFALMESKVAIAYLAYNFKIEPTVKTPIPVAIDKKLGINRPVANLELRFVPRTH